MISADDGTEARREEALAMRDGALDGARLVALLADEDWRVRKQAAESATARLAEPRVMELLLEALLQPDDVGLRNAAVEALARADARDAGRVAGALGQALSRAEPAARKFLAAALVGGAESGLVTLAELAGVEDVMTASAAVEALATLAWRGVESAAVQEVLVAVLARPEPVLRLAAIDGLVACNAIVPAAALRDVLADPITRTSAARLLARAGGEEGLALLLEMLGRPRERADAALALAHRSAPPLGSEPDELARIGEALRALDDEAIASLASAFRSSSVEDGRRLARLALEVGELRLLPAVVELGARAELDGRSRTALVELGPRTTDPLLDIVEARTSDEPRIAAWALEAAAELTALVTSPMPSTLARITTLARQLAETGDDVARRAAAAVLDRAEPARSRRSSRPAPPSDELEVLLSSDDPSHRASALDALVAVESTERIERVALALTDEDERVQLAALRALARARSADAAAAAVRVSRVALGSELDSVRAEATATLSSLGAFHEEPRLGELLTLTADPSPRVVIAALRALELAGLHAGEDARAGLVDAALDRCLEHADPEVVKEALLPVGHGAREATFARACRALGHPHWSVRVRAAEVLGRAPSRAGALEALEARAPLETDELVLRALAAGLANGSDRGEGA